jgi:hypothetical protein
MFKKRKNPTPGFRLVPPFNPGTGKYAQLIPDEETDQWRRFELKEDLDGPGATTAYLLKYNKQTDEYTIGATEEAYTEFDLYNFLEDWSGVGRVVDGEDITDGTRGWCKKQDGRWEVVGGGGSSIVKFAKLDATLSAGSSCAASIWSGDPLADSGDNENVYDWWLPSGGELPATTKVAIFSNDGKWYVLCAWVTKTIVTDVTISGGTLGVFPHKQNLFHRVSQ